MYTVSDIVEMGNAQDLVLTLIKLPPSSDDFEDFTVEPDEYFDE